MSNEPETTLPQRIPAQGALSRRALVAPLEQSDDEFLRLDRYLQILLRRKWLLVAVTLTVIVGTTLQVLTTTPLYTAVATLQIDPESENILPYEEVQTAGSIGGWLLYEYIETQARKFRSRNLGHRVAERLDLAENPRFNAPVRAGFFRDLQAGLMEAARSLFRSKRRRPAREASAKPAENAAAGGVLAGLTVIPVEDTRLIEVSFTSPDPQLAGAIANAAVEEFIEQHLEEKYQSTLRATEFLRKQLLDLQVQVEESEERLLEYAQQNNIVNLNDREDLARSRLADLNDELTAAETELITRSTRYNSAQTAAPETFPESFATAGIQALEQRKSELELELAGFSSQYGPEWPEVKRLRREIAQISGQLEASKVRVLGSAKQDFELAAARRARLSAAVASQRELVDELNQSSIQYKILKREVDSTKEIYEGLLQRLKEASVAAGLRSSNIHFADRAAVPGGPSYPQKYRTVLLSSLAGLALGLLIVIVVDKLDNTLKSADDVTEFLGLPSLGVVPSLGSPRKVPLISRILPWRRKVVAEPFIAFDGSDHDIGQRALEAYRSLRTSLLLSHSGRPPQTILVTSALPGEGKSTTAANIAIALSQTGARTLLMECDLRRPALSEAFGITSDSGMSSYLSGNSDLSSQIQETAFSDLLIVPAGLQAPNPVELLGSQKMATGLELMRDYFTYIVLDSPPVLELSDTLIISALVEGSILVARAGKTPRKAVARAAGQLLGIGSTLLGVVVNDVELSRQAYGYSYHPYSVGDSGYFGAARRADKS